MEIGAIRSFSELIMSIETEQAFIPHLNEKSEFLGKIIAPKSSYTILIGPEGDFTEQEVSDAMSRGILPASLGANRLRTETAGLIAGQIIATINEIDCDN
jgi:16S rRNA (uracil1498-N3)-methyltransferase